MWLSPKNTAPPLKCRARFLHIVQRTWQQAHLVRVMVKLLGGIMWAQPGSNSSRDVRFSALRWCHEVSVTMCRHLIMSVGPHSHFTLLPSLVSVYLKWKGQAIYFRSCVLVKKQTALWLLPNYLIDCSRKLFFTWHHHLDQQRYDSDPSKCLIYYEY